MTPVETRARTMSKQQRVMYLRDRDWHRLSHLGAQSWQAPDYPATRGVSRWLPQFAGR